jgi:hypothetical protein
MRFDLMKNPANEIVSGTDGTAHANTQLEANGTIASVAGVNTNPDIQLGQTNQTMSDAAVANTLAAGNVTSGTAGNVTSGMDGTAQANTQVGANATDPAATADGHSNGQIATANDTSGAAADAHADTQVGGVNATVSGTNATSAASLGGLTPTIDHAVASVAPSTATMASANTPATTDATLGGLTPTSDHAVASVAPSTAAMAGANTTATSAATLGGPTLTSDHAVAGAAPSTGAIDQSAGTSAPLHPVKVADLLDSQGPDMFVFVFDTTTNAHQAVADLHAAQVALDLASVLKQVGSMGHAPLADHTANLVAHATDPAASSPSHDPTAGITVVTIDHLLPQQLHGSDLFFH